MSPRPDNPRWEPTLRGTDGCFTRPPKEGPTPPISDDYYTKSICPSGGHGRGHRLALQNRAAARHTQLTVNSLHARQREPLSSAGSS